MNDKQFELLMERLDVLTSPVVMRDERGWVQKHVYLRLAEKLEQQKSNYRRVSKEREYDQYSIEKLYDEIKTLKAEVHKQARLRMELATTLLEKEKVIDSQGCPAMHYAEFPFQRAGYFTQCPCGKGWVRHG